MKRLIAAFVLFPTYALAHHEVVVVASMLPLMGGLVGIAAAGFTAFRKWSRNR